MLTRKPTLIPRARRHPVGFGYGNYLPVANHAHAAARSQVTVERVVKITSPTDSRTLDSKTVMAGRAPA
jgi:hypothetical protein